MKRIEELEGLRGVLAMWVFFCHIIPTRGYHWADYRQPARTLINGTLAVDVFMILSGFVISMLIMGRREPYGLFIGRRFLRLYPTYLICFVAAFALSIAGVLPKVYLDSQLLPHAFAHLTMLHGVIPNRILPHAADAFWAPAWSISTEWQFYLLVPLFFAAFRSRPVLAWTSLLAIALVGSRITGHFGSWDHAAFLPLKLHLFALGIFCYFVFMWADERRELLRGGGPYITATLLLFALMFSVVTTYVGVYIWLIVFGSVLAVRLGTGTAFDKAVSAFLKSKSLQWLGTISYSLYLSHEIIIWSVVKVLKTTMPTLSQSQVFLGVTALAIPIALVLSHLLFHVVELPAIQFGKRLGNRSVARGPVPDKAATS